MARAVLLATTDGPDAEELAAMRRAFAWDDHVEQMRALVGPKAEA